MAVSLTAADLAAAGGERIDETLAARLLPVAREMVDRYAPNAPDEVSNEAAIRCAGYLTVAPDNVVQQSAGPLQASYAVSRQSTLRHSGAMSLLAPYKVRRIL